LWFFEGCKAKIRLHYSDVGEDLLSVLGLEAGVNNDIVTYFMVRECKRREPVVRILTGNPVNRGGDSVLVTSLERVDNAEHLSGVATSGSGVWEDCADGLLGVDDEDGADGESNALGVDVGGVLVVKHVVGEGDLALLVANDRELEARARDLVNVLDPATVAVDSVGRETDELYTTLGELRLELGEGTELGGADGSVVLGVREQDHPLVSDELVEVDGTRNSSASGSQQKSTRQASSNLPVGGVGIEVRGNAAEAEGLRSLGHVECECVCMNEIKEEELLAKDNRRRAWSGVESRGLSIAGP
jgi:hypothetical protein